jgi:uncharacterized membrane protein YjjB (DUF3815 family)
MMRLTESLYVFLIIDLLASFALSYAGLWYFVFVPSALLGLLMKSSWMNLVYFGLTGAIGAVIPIFLSDTGSRFANASLVGAIIGLPGGFIGPFGVTIIIAFLASGLGAVVTSSLRPAK